jgi:hypothetical protein
MGFAPLFTIIDRKLSHFPQLSPLSAPPPFSHPRFPALVCPLSSPLTSIHFLLPVLSASIFTTSPPQLITLKPMAVWNVFTVASKINFAHQHNHCRLVSTSSPASCLPYELSPLHKILSHLLRPLVLAF